MSKNPLKQYIEESIALQQLLMTDDKFHKTLTKIIILIRKCLKGKNKLLIAGNGGSAADAMHLAAEFVGHYKRERRGLPAIALSTDPSVASAIANDYAFEDSFARQLEALGRKGDIFIGFSTSGKSKNLLKALEKAKKMGIKRVCFLGGNGGEARNLLSDYTLVVPSNNTPRIQETHTLLLHIISEEVEKDF